jgi:hypothetical protein
VAAHRFPDDNLVFFKTSTILSSVFWSYFAKITPSTLRQPQTLLAMQISQVNKLEALETGIQGSSTLLTLGDSHDDLRIASLR